MLELIVKCSRQIPNARADLLNFIFGLFLEVLGTTDKPAEFGRFGGGVCGWGFGIPSESRQLTQFTSCSTFGDSWEGGWFIFSL